MERQSRVLVVDDDQFALQSIAKALEGESYGMVTATSGSEALDLLKQGSFDLVLTDLKMPEVDGLEVLRQVGEIAPQAVVLILTGYASLESAIEALRGGAYDYLVKPCSEDELKLKIGRGLERARLIEERQRAEDALRELLEKIERAKQEWESTADSLSELICLVDARGRIIRANRTVETWNLGRVVDVRSREFHELLHPGCMDSSCYLHSFWKQAWREALRGQPAQCEAYDEILQRHVLAQIQPWKGKAIGSTVVVVRDITERKRAEEARRELNASLEARTFELQVLYELSQQIGYTLDYEELFRLMIEHLHRALVYDVSATLLVTEDVCELFIQPTRPLSPAVQEGLQKRLVNTFAAMSGQPVDVRRLNTRFLERLASGETTPPVSSLGSAFQVPLIADPKKEVVGLLFVGAEQEEAFTEDQVRLLYTVANEASGSIQRLRALMAAEHQRLESPMRSLPEGVLLLNAEGRIVLTNPAGREYLALLTDAGVGDVLTHLGERSFKELLGPPPEGEICHEVVLEDSPHQAFEVIAQPLGTGSQVGNWVLVIRDITEHKRAEEELAYMAIHDPLTGVPNRLGFFALAEQQLRMANRTNRGTMLLFADLDGLKQINDTFGHHEGDQALIAVASILTETFRESDIVARMGGDEFVILAMQADGADAEVLTTRLRNNLETYNENAGRRYKLSLSVGVAHYDPRQPCSLDELLTRADRLMYEQKQSKNKPCES